MWRFVVFFLRSFFDSDYFLICYMLVIMLKGKSFKIKNWGEKNIVLFKNLDENC